MKNYKIERKGLDPKVLISNIRKTVQTVYQVDRVNDKILLGSDLKDINGEEIFEADKIQIEGESSSYKVYWSEGAFRVGNWLLGDVYHKSKIVK